MEIKWSSNSINDLIEIVSYLKKNKMGEILEHLANYFIQKHKKYMDIENYSMNFSSDCDIDLTIISDGEYKLAFICEIVNLHSYNIVLLKKKKAKKHREKEGFKNVYSCVAYMIKYCIYKSLNISFSKIDYKGFYLTALLKDYLLPNSKISGKDDPILNILNISYYLVSEIIKIGRKTPKIIFLLTSLISNTENLDISLLSPDAIRSLCDILNTKRTIYARFILILTYEILKIPDVLNPNWLMENIIFNSQDEFLEIMNSPLIETIIFLTSYRISVKDDF